MIEIEKKFILRPGDKERLIAGAEFVSKNKHTDVYYDTDDYQLTTKDWWLRQRNGKFELKVGLPGNSTDREFVDRYQEISDENEIRKFLQLRGSDSLVKVLAKQGISPFGLYTTERVTYKKDGFRIDWDKMDFGLEETEIELLVDNESKIPEAVQKILAFAREHRLAMEELIGKTPEYIRRTNKKHWQALKKAGIV